MLHALEARLTAVVAAALTGRTGLTVRGAGAPPAPTAGTGALHIGLAELTMENGFESGLRTVTSGPAGPVSRRVLPLRFAARLDFARRPATDDDDARLLLLEDLSLAGYLLSAPEFRSGAAFAPDDPDTDTGFEVHGFDLGAGTLAPLPADGLLRGTLTGSGRAIVWPPIPASPEGEILDVGSAVTLIPAGDV